MSFNQMKLTRAISQTTGIYNTYIYATDDTLDDVQTDGYFSASRFIELDSQNTNSQGWFGGLIGVDCLDGFATLLIDTDGNTSFISLSSRANVSDINIGEFTTMDSQEPTGLGDANKIIIHYGVGGQTSGGEFTVHPTGEVECHKNNTQYIFDATLRFMRDGSGGVSELLARIMYAPDGVNYFQVGDTFGALVDNDKTVWREGFVVRFSPFVGSKLKVELARNNGSHNSGGIGTFQPIGDLSGWNPICTTSLDILKAEID